MKITLYFAVNMRAYRIPNKSPAPIYPSDLSGAESSNQAPILPTFVDPSRSVCETEELYSVAMHTYRQHECGAPWL